jgi:hypothetical protein
MPTIMNHTNGIFIWHVALLPFSMCIVQKHQIVTAAELYMPSKHAQHLDVKYVAALHIEVW